MSGLPPIAPVASAALQAGGLPALQAPAPAPANFAALLSQGIQGLEAKVANADQLVQRFAVGEDIPVHQVTFALEEARLSVEMAMQVRARLVEAYRDLMNMQL